MLLCGKDQDKKIINSSPTYLIDLINKGTTSTCLQIRYSSHHIYISFIGVHSNDDVFLYTVKRILYVHCILCNSKVQLSAIFVQLHHTIVLSNKIANKSTYNHNDTPASYRIVVNLCKKSAYGLFTVRLDSTRKIKMDMDTYNVTSSYLKFRIRSEN